MSTNVQKSLRSVKRWNVFEFTGTGYEPIYPFALSWSEAMCARSEYACVDAGAGLVSFVVLPYGCSF